MPEARHELAPTGTLRFAVNLSNPSLSRVEGGCTLGPAPDAARHIARRLGVTLTILPYPSGGAIMKAAGEWGAAVLAVETSRESLVFSPTIAFVDAMFAASSGGPAAFGDVDRDEVRIASAAGAAYTAHLSRTIKSATLLITSTPSAALDALLSHRCEVAAGLREALEEATAQAAALRLLPEPFLRVPQAIAVPAAHHAAAKFVRVALSEL